MSWNAQRSACLCVSQALGFKVCATTLSNLTVLKVYLIIKQLSGFVFLKNWVPYLPYWTCLRSVTSLNHPQFLALSEWETPFLCAILTFKDWPLSTSNEWNPQPHPGSDRMLVFWGKYPFLCVNLWIHVSLKAHIVVNVGSNCRHSKFTLFSHISLEGEDHQNICHLKGWPRFHSHS